MKLMKKVVALLLVALMTMSLFVGCAKDKNEILEYDLAPADIPLAKYVKEMK